MQPGIVIRTVQCICRLVMWENYMVIIKESCTEGTTAQQSNPHTSFCIRSIVCEGQTAS